MERFRHLFYQHWGQYAYRRWNGPTQQSGQTPSDQLPGVGHDAVNQFLADRDIADQARNHAAGPDTGIHFQAMANRRAFNEDILSILYQ